MPEVANTNPAECFGGPARLLVKVRQGSNGVARPAVAANPAAGPELLTWLYALDAPTSIKRPDTAHGLSGSHPRGADQHGDGVEVPAFRATAKGARLDMASDEKTPRIRFAADGAGCRHSVAQRMAAQVRLLCAEHGKR